jgi:hypothetical protein
MPRRGPCLGELLVLAPNRASNTTASTWIRDRQGGQLSAHAAVPATDVRRGYRCVGALQPYQRRGYRRAGSQVRRLAAVSMQVRANSGSSCAALAPPTFWRAVFQACSLSRSGSPRPSCQQRTKHELPCFALLCFAWLPPSSSYSSKSSEKAKRLEFQAPSSRRLERRPSRLRDRARLSLEISTHSHFAPTLLGSWLDSSGKCAYAVRRVLVG